MQKVDRISFLFGVLVTLVLILGIFAVVLFFQVQQSDAHSKYPDNTPIIVVITATESVVSKTYTPLAAGETQAVKPTNQIFEATVTSQSIQLALCDGQKHDIFCYNRPAIKDSNFLITLWIDNLDKSKIPYVIIGDTKLHCQVASFLLNSISCYGPIIANGKWKIELFSADRILLCSGNITIDLSPPAHPTPTHILYP